MRTQSLSPLSRLAKFQKKGYNKPVVQSKIAVLSGACTRTGPWGAPTPRGLPLFAFPLSILPDTCQNCKSYSITLRKNSLLLAQTGVFALGCVWA